MVLHPGRDLKCRSSALPEKSLPVSDVQKKAQAEIDAVVGNDRLPTFADRPNLPYIDAVVSEVFRWNSVLPIGQSCDNIREETTDLVIYRCSSYGDGGFHPQWISYPQGLYDYD